jgi:prefoldin subunit 4
MSAATVGNMRTGVKLQKQDTHIERVDQEKINAFARANLKAHDLRGEIKKLKEEIDNLEDAALLVEESMGEGLKLFLGECFVTVDEEQGSQYVTSITEEKQEELEKKNDALEKLEKEMKNYKTYLYAKFGSSINLEE